MVSFGASPVVVAEEVVGSADDALPPSEAADSEALAAADEVGAAELASEASEASEAPVEAEDAASDADAVAEARAPELAPSISDAYCEQRLESAAEQFIRATES